jgi:copper chaperone CopZ
MNLRTIFLLLGSLAVAGLARADYSVTLSDVHVCCKGCVDDANDAVQPSGATANIDRKKHEIKISAADQATAQKAVDALVSAGFYGKPSDSAIHLADTSAPSGEVHGLKVSGVHLCCKSCVKAVNGAVAKVSGVTGTTAQKDSDSFEIQGDFNAQDVIAALHAAGFSAKVD